jgi:hypothetical protein
VAPDERTPLHAYYELGLEHRRLDVDLETIEFARTKEIVTRHLPLARASSPTSVAAPAGTRHG